MCNHFELEDYVTRRIFAFTRAFCWKETFFFYVPKFFFCAIISLSWNCFVSDFAPRKLLFVRHYTMCSSVKSRAYVKVKRLRMRDEDLATFCPIYNSGSPSNKNKEIISQRFI